MECWAAALVFRQECSGPGSMELVQRDAEVWAGVVEEGGAAMRAEHVGIEAPWVRFWVRSGRKRVPPSGGV